MKSKYFVHSAFVLVMFMIGMDVSFGQTPNAMTLTAKVRDFNEEPDGSLPVSAGRHPDFNTIGGCAGKGYVDAQILTNGLVDTAVFPLDNRNPRLISTNRGCFAGDAEFNQWFNDAASTVNRPFLHDLVFTRSTTRPGMFEYENRNFYPVDDALVNAVPQTITRNLPGSTIASFGHNTNNNKNHNYGFTMEFHANFTFLAEIPGTRPAQKFVFRGDDDVWVFIDGKLAIDLGGVHGAQTDSITFDAATVARFGLIDGQKYVLDFFFAERHVVESNCFITTSLQLETKKVGTPRATPGTSLFTSIVNVKLETDPTDAVIHYTTNGTTPDSTSPTYTGPIPITATTTIKAIAIKAGWTNSDVMSETYTKSFVLSTLDILDANNNAVNYLTEKNLSYIVKVTTTQANLGPINPVASTKVSLDRDVLTLSTSTNVGDNIIYTGSVPFLITPTAVLASGKTEANPYDSLIVRWANPKDSTRDIAVARKLIRPAPLLATGYFSFDSLGTLPTDQYLGTETKLYLIITDQILPTGVKPTVTIETQPTLGGGRVKDTETFDLVLVSPGKYRLTIPVDINATSTAGDKKLQLSLNDGITATYKDPVDVPETIVINAGYGRAPDIEASLQFTDKLNNALPDGIYYSPDEGSLYLTYKDDWVSGTILTKSVTLTITNNGGNAPGDAETFTIPLVLAKKSGSTGVWEGSLKLAARPAIKAGNDTADTYVLGDVLAVVTSHSKTGEAMTTQAKDNLFVAYANKIPEIIIDGGEPGVKPTREDTAVTITVIDQDFSNARDTLYTTLSCTVSKDVFLNLMLIETGEKTGIYKSTVISKSEGAKLDDDGKLQCLSKDNIKLTYKDPVYGDSKDEQVSLDKPVETRIRYSSNADGTGEITSVNDLTAQSFYAVITARTPDVAKIDKLTVSFTTAQGESENFEAVETGPATGIFIVKVPFRFVDVLTTAPNNVLEGKITAKETNNLVTATGSVTLDGNTAKRPIDLVASFAATQKAYIKDTDGDGKGDKVYIVFEKRLGSLPATVVSQWNDGALAGKTATGGAITFLNSDSNIIVVDYKSSPFTLGATAPKSGEPPRAALPLNEIFQGQKPVIEDSIGPIILTAVKKPSNVNTAIANDPNFNLDTLVITLSEPLKTADFKQMLKFATSCDDYAHAKIIEAVNVIVGAEPKTNVYTVIVDKTGEAPSVGNCIFLNTDQGRYTDVPTNVPPEYGVKLDGSDGKNLIQVFRGFPPVAGLDPNNPNFQVAVQDTRDPKKQGYATPGSVNPWEVVWIPPVGYDPESKTLNPYTVGSINDLPTGTRETSTPITLPGSISTIQVVSTTAYIAHVSIFDVYGNFVAKSTQVFGGRGELQNQARIVPKGLVSYLFWDTKDSKGQLAGQGVYVWKVQFEFKGGKQEVQYTRTGLMRPRN